MGVLNIYPDPDRSCCTLSSTMALFEGCGLVVWSQLRFPFKLPGVLALGATILVASFFLVSFAERVRRCGAQSDKGTLEGL